MVRTVKPYVPREFRVTFADRLVKAEIAPTAVAATSPLPPVPPEPAPAPPPAAAEPAPTPPPADLWLTEIGAALAADRKAIEATLAAVRDGMTELRTERSGRLAEWQAAAVELGLNIASKLLHERVTADQFPIEAMVRNMAGEMHDDEVVTVRLNPADLELLEKRLDGEPLLPGGRDPAVVPDPTLGRAECRVEGRASVSLSDLTRQLNQIRDDLLRSLAHARS
jgi:flagellar biosynthesis/type III secretory pathway protein FliH